MLQAEAEPVVHPPVKSKRSLSPRSQSLLDLRATLSICSKAHGCRGDFPGAMAAIQALKATGLALPPPHAYNLLLNIASRATSLEKSVAVDAVKVFEDMVAQRVPLNEASYASIIRVCSLAGDTERGHKLLQQMKNSSIVPRLRTYAPLVRALADKGDLPGVQALFSDMASHKISPQQPEYACLLRVLGSSGYSPYHAAAPFLAVAEEHPVLDSDLASAVEEVAGGGLQKGAQPSASWFWTSRRVVIPRTGSGHCPATGHTLKSLDVSPQEVASLAKQSRSLAGEGTSEQSGFSAFSSWLAAQEAAGGPYEVLIDGPNVGFYGQNFDKGALMYSQVEAIREKFAQAGKRALIIIGERWLHPKSFADPGARRTGIKRANFYAARSRGEAVGGYPIDGAGSRKRSHCLNEAPTASETTHHNNAPSLSNNNGQIQDSTQCWSALESEEEGEGEEEEDRVESDWRSGNSDSGSSNPVSSSHNCFEEGKSGSFGCKEVEDVSSRVPVSAELDSQQAGETIKKWVQEGSVYSVPKGFNDDWFWMYAAFVSPVASRVILVSNDYMRDHHFQMLAPRAFLTWRERHQVRFSFQDLSRGGGTSAPRERCMQMTLYHPPVFSLRAQASQDGSVLHFPLSLGASGGVPDEWIAVWDSRKFPAASKEVMTAKERPLEVQLK